MAGSLKQSAGLLIYRFRDGMPEVFLVHPGGPFWEHRDEHAWSIPKGLLDAGEEPLAAARREFHEETGQQPPAGEAVELQPIVQSNGKTVLAWAVEGEVDASNIRSNTCEIEWPHGSGKRITIPEVDRGAWFGLNEARHKLHKGQGQIVDQLAILLGQR